MDYTQLIYLSGILASVILIILRIKTYKLNLFTVMILSGICLLSWFGFIFMMFGDDSEEESKSGFKE